MEYEEVLNNIGFGPYQWRLLFLCGTPYIADSMEILLMSFISSGAQADFGCSKFAISFVSSSVFFGMFFGAVGFGLLSDSIGRRKSFACCMAFMAVCGMLSALSPNVYVLMLIRAMVGMGCGGLHIGITLYSEFLPTSSRTVQLTLIQVFWTFGVIIQCGLAWALSSYSWRYLVVASTFPTVIAGMLYFVLPESPRFLLLHQREDEAVQLIKSVAFMNGTETHIPEPLVIATPENASTESNESWKQRFLSLFNHSIVKQLTIALSTSWFSASFVYYGMVLLTTQIEYSGNQYLAMMVVSIAELPGYVGTYVFAVYIGRKRGMLWSAAGTAVCLALLSLQNVASGWMIVVIMFAGRMFVSVYFALVALYTPEAFPTSIRSTG
eukprot:PhF_6_TR19067/c0_g1_i2/m.28031